MFLKVVYKGTPVAETFYEDEIIKVEHPKAGVVIITLLPSGKVQEFHANIDCVESSGEVTTEGYSNDVYLMNSAGQTIERII